jgi:hypothetical protein
MSEQMGWRQARDNPGALAAWMLQLVDRSPDRLGVILIPHHGVRTDAEIDELERVVSREFDRAKLERTDLAIGFRNGMPEHPDAAMLIVVHQHRWVGGHCVNGCGDTRVPADGRRRPNPGRDVR